MPNKSRMKWSLAMETMLKCLFAVMLFSGGLNNIPFVSNAYAEDFGESDEETAEVLATDVYDFSLRLNVPQVLNNATSRGVRKYKPQTIKGLMYIKWLPNGSFKIEFEDLYNKNFKVGGSNVRYTGYEDRNIVYTRYNYIGNNATESFKTPCICFYLELEPSYAIGGNNEDNSFYVLLSGKGSSTFQSKLGSRIAKKFTGYASGTQGCGCAAYTHKSPTRGATICGPMGDVSDVVSTWGRWTAKFRKRVSCGGAIVICR